MGIKDLNLYKISSVLLFICSSIFASDKLDTITLKPAGVIVDNNDVKVSSQVFSEFGIEKVPTSIREIMLNNDLEELEIINHTPNQHTLKKDISFGSDLVFPLHGTDEEKMNRLKTAPKYLIVLDSIESEEDETYHLTKFGVHIKKRTSDFCRNLSEDRSAFSPRCKYETIHSLVTYGYHSVYNPGCGIDWKTLLMKQKFWISCKKYDESTVILYDVSEEDLNEFNNVIEEIVR